ncbi:MAG: superinfection immunity protein [Candidatus Dormibacteria bacterium]
MFGRFFVSSPLTYIAGILGVVVYFLPTLIAVRRHRSCLLVFLINLFFGWAVIGWIIALILALR